MFFVIYTIIWLAVSIIMSVVSFLAGKLPILDNSPLPWVMHRSYIPPPPPQCRA
jgi:hypothetical protein